MVWQLLSLWLLAHPTGVLHFRAATSQESNLLSAQSAGRVLFYIDRDGRLHLRERDPAVIACAWVRALSSSVPCRH